MRVPVHVTIQSYEALIHGIQTHCPDGSFILRGKSYTAAQAIAFLEALQNAAIAVRDAKCAWKDAMAAARQAEATDGVVARELRDVLALSFSQMHTALGELGLQPRKVRTPLSVEARLAATAKLRATRKARGTTSRKQKLLITGGVTGVTIAPVLGVGENSESPAPTVTGQAGDRIPDAVIR
jgi:hypothetical protein